MEPFLGQIILFAGNFAPRGWAFCQGQLLPIAQNTALFSLLGTTYGGNGSSTFGLPDLRGRVPVGFGQGPGLINVQLGEAAGQSATTLQTTNLPAHTHTLSAVSETGNAGSPANAFLAATGAIDPEYRTSGTPVAMAAGAVGTVGGSQPFSNMPPYLGMNYIIALQGIFPSRD